MKKLISFASMTDAIKARDFLRSRNISAKTIRTPAKFRRGSCGYSLVIYGNHGEEELLREKSIPFRGVFAYDAG